MWQTVSSVVVVVAADVDSIRRRYYLDICRCRKSVRKAFLQENDPERVALISYLLRSHLGGPWMPFRFLI